ncbi:hypothetical protein IP88_14675 [alpha proteobacterium AAP81b]|nr:hypothetical protein IP88_14675 [alpha proteobacterium AAP81b]
MKVDSARIEALARRWDPAVRLVLLHGADTATSADLAGQIARGFSDPGNPTAIETLDGKSLAKDPQALAGAAGAMSMFGDRTLVRVDGLDDDGLAAVEALLAAPAGNPVVAVAGALRKGSKLLALAEKAPGIAALVSYEPSLRDAPRLVGDMAATLGLKVPREAAVALFEATGGDRQILRSELEKLALYVDASPDKPRPLDPADIAAVGSGAGDADAQLLPAAIAGGRVREASDLVARLAEPGIVTLRAVARRFTQLLALREAVDAGASPRDAVERARPPVFWKEKDAVVAEVGLWSTAAAAAALAALLAAERAIKSSGSLGDTLAHAALLDLARQAAAKRRG